MGKHTEARLRRINQILTLKRQLDQGVKQWLAELDSQQRTKGEIVNQICRSLANELNKLRHRAGEADLAAFGDAAGAMAVTAQRPRAVDFKLRGLREQFAELHKLLEEALQQTMSAEFKMGRRKDG